MNRIIGLLLIVAVACTPKAEQEETKSMKKLDIQGHRGARGLFPENTIEGFVYATNLGVTTLEMDLAITADSQIVVSHEPYFSSEIATKPTGEAVTEAEAKSLNIYQMNYDQVAAYDCGLREHSRFPDQRKMPAIKPRLLDVFDTIEAIAKPFYNIEIKSTEATDGIYHPIYTDFVDMVVKGIDRSGISWDRITLQSFDFRVILYLNQVYPEIRLALLIENELSWQENIDSLGFTPEIYSTYYRLISGQEEVKAIQASGMQLIPWTVNDSQSMQELVAWGVDGLITDYPNIAVDLFLEQ